MTQYRNHLPQLSKDLFLTDGGTETELIYTRGFELPCFASFHLLNDRKGYAAIREYYRRHAEIAIRYQAGFILDSLTYRASTDWGIELGYSKQGLDQMNHAAISLLREIKKEYQTEESKMVISGAIGPREDAYLPNGLMSPDEAENYHRTQISSLDKAGVDMVCAMTLNEPDEAIGIARAAQSLGIPSAISFSLETNGNLLNGGLLKNAIETIDHATNNAPAYYMINCAHPTHFENILSQENWVSRIRGIRANASCKSHAELWQSKILEDDGAEEFGKLNAELASKYRHLNIFGGCCGSNHRHVEEICKSVLKTTL